MSARDPIPTSGILAVCTALALPLVYAPSEAQQSTAPEVQTASAAHMERTDLTGTWERYHEKTFKIDPRISSPLARESEPPLKPKYLAEWRARQKAAHEADQRGQPIYGGYAQCLPDGMPAMMMAMFPMQVLQTPGQITIIEEAYRQVRYIYLDQTQVPIADAEPGFWGHSVGHWQGGTLVANTVGIKEEVRFHDVPHSDQMQINERIRLVTPDRFEDEITVIDPVYLTKPWTFTWEYQRRAGYKMLEYVCEDNREYRDPKTGGQRLQLLDPSGKP
jgi:hypothetical protein